MSEWTRRALAYQPDSADWRLVGLSLGVTVLFVTYILYWNRLLASIICFCLRFATWDKHAPGSFWIEAESIHFSLISGRIILRDVRYYSANQTIRAVKCFITWRYWLWRTRDKNDNEPDGPEEGEQGVSSSRMPCRILLQFEGLEWLLYNRTMVYDEILKQAQNVAEGETPAPALARSRSGTNEHQNLLQEPERSRWSPDTRPSAMPIEQSTEFFKPEDDAEGQRYPPVGFRIALPRLDLPSRIWAWVTSRLPIFDFNDLLPIALEAKNGAISLGNASTPVIFTIKFGAGSGIYGIKPSRSRFDEYKQIYTLIFHKVSVTAEDNKDHLASMAEHGKRLHEVFNSIKPRSRMKYAFSGFRSSMMGISTVAIDKPKEQTSQPSKWTGLGTFMTEAEKEQQRREEAEEAKRLAEKKRHEVGPEYAKDGNLLETPTLELVYYADVAGRVPENPVSMEATDELVDVGNGDIAPQWGVDLMMHGGSIVYGPWADRQRVHLQRALSPPAFSAIFPTKRLEEGELRLCTEFRLFVEFARDVTLRIPCREASKDWQFDMLPDLGQQKRQAAQISCKITRGSTLHYVMPIVASESGYQTSFKAQLLNIAVDSSLNSKVFLEASECRIQGSLPAPLRWNQARRWDFIITLQDPEVYLLRDHITLLTDLGRDWSAGPPHDLTHFIPMLYTVKFNLKNYSLAFNVNDQNIVDSLNDPDANALMTLRGSSLNSDVTIPSIKYCPESITVPFFFESSDRLTLSLTFPKWNTRAAHATSQITDLGQIESLRIDGSYRYHSAIRPEFVDRLTLNIHGRTVTFKCFGWAIRHFMVLQANYFGSFTNFTLPSEAISKRQKETSGDPSHEKWREGQTNLLEAMLEVDVSDATVALPEALLGYEQWQNPEHARTAGIGSCLLLSVPEFLLSFRIHDYSMEMTANAHPISVSSEANYTDEDLWHAAKDRRRRNDIFTISELCIVAHRLFGPCPMTATYICIWEIVVGEIQGVITPLELQKISSALSSFYLNFKDELNAPAEEYNLELYPDVTFLKLRLSAIHISLETNTAALTLSLPEGIQLSHNDMPTMTRAGLTSVFLPRGHIQSLIKASKDGNTWLEAGAVELDVALDVYSRPCNWRSMAEKQLAFVKEQDSLTRRVPFVYDPDSFYGSKSTRYASLLLPHPTHIKPLPSRGSEPKFVERKPSLESEESYNAINVDERLALSKPPSVHNFPASVQESSVTDESDEPYSGSESMPVTDEYEYDEWIDNYGWPELSHHANIVRQFKDLRVNQSSNLRGPRFQLMRDAQVPGPARVEEDRLNACNDGFNETMSSAEETSIFHIVSRRGLKIVINPILVHVVQSIMPNVYSPEPSLELELDRIMSKFLGLNASAKTASQAFIHATVPNVHLRSIQSILSSQEADLLREPFGGPPPSTFLPVHSRIVSVLDISISRPTASGILGSAERPLSLSSREAKVSLLKYDSHLLAMMHQSHKSRAIPVLELSIADSGAVFGKTVLSNLGNVKAWLHAEAPAPVLATVAMGLKVASQIQGAFNKWANMSAARSRFIIWRILEATDKTQSDPLSRAVTSYLVQSGRPSQLRGDICWKILNHARLCLPRLSSKERENILNTVRQGDWEPEVAIADMTTSFRKTWHDWTMDISEAEINRLPLWKLLAPTKKGPIVSDIIQPIYIQTGFFHFILDDPNQDSRNTGSNIRIGPFKINVLERHPSFIVLQPAGSTASLTRTANATLVHQNLRHVGVVCDLGEFHVHLTPTLLPFAGRVVRAQRHLTPPPKSPTSPTFGRMQNMVPSPKPANHFVVDLSLHFEDLKIISTAYNFSFELSLLHPTLVVHSRLGSLSRRPLLQLAADTAGSIACSWENFLLRATEAVENRPQTTLAEFGIDSLYTTAAWYSRTRDRPIIRISMTIGNMQFSIPRHISRLLQSVETWWDGYFLNQVDPFISLIALPQNPRPPRKVVFKPQESVTFDLQANITTLVVRLHAVLGVWLVWEIQNLGMAGYGSKSLNTESAQGGVVIKLRSHSLALETWQDPDNRETILPQHSFRFPFPPLQVSARITNNFVKCQGTVDLFELTLNANAIDAFVRASRQLASSDLDRIFTLFQRTRDIHPQDFRSSPSRPIRTNLTLEAQFVISGFRIVLEGASSLCFLDIRDIFAEGSGPKVWTLKVSDVSFSLAPSVAASKKDFDRRYRLAYMVFDLYITSSHDQGSETHILDFQTSKIHAVLQAAALGVLGDLVDSYQGEVLQGQEEVMRQRTMRRQRHQSVSKRPAQPFERVPAKSWLERRIINVNVSNFGAAIPLSIHQSDSFLPEELTTMSAFLFSIATISFNTHAGEASSATISRFAFQFLTSFDQSQPSGFISRNHISQNQMVYPEMKVDVHPRSTASSVEWVVDGHVSGFELDLDPSISSFLFSLLDVYRLGVSQLETLAEAVQPSNSASPHPRDDKPPPPRGKSNLRATHIVSSLEFQSGRVRLHHEEKHDALRVRSSSLLSINPGARNSAVSADILLPVVSLWAEWRATPALMKAGSLGGDPLSSLAFKTTIHSSRNTIPPTILKFLSQLLAKVETRLNRPSLVPASTIKDAAKEEVEEAVPGVLQAMSITFSLRIDQSTLEFTCLPDVNVLGALHWESGGFVIIASPGTKTTSFIGSVENLTASLRHGYLSDNCVEASISNLAFSSTLSTSRDERGVSSSRTSIVVETDLRATALFSRLQDVLCFKAVWFDSFSVSNSQGITPISPLTAASRESSSSILRPSRRKWTTAILVKVRTLEALANLGSGISIARLTLEPVVLRTLLSDQVSELFFSVDSLHLSAEGLFSGNIAVPDFLFRTVRGREGNYEFRDEKQTLLRIELQSGHLGMSMSFENKPIFLYDSEPLQILTLDDWSQCLGTVHDPQLQLHFILVATGVNIAGVTTAPAVFVDMVQRIQVLLAAQYEGAARESDAYRRTMAPKRRLNEVASSVARGSTRERLVSTGWTTVQNMRVKLDNLFIGLARDSLADAQPWGGLQASGFEAMLTRNVRGPEDEQGNKLSLALGSLQLHQFVSPASEEIVNATQWLQRHCSEKREVLKVPTMQIVMKTREFNENGNPILAYDLENELGSQNRNRQFSIGTDIVLFDWVRHMYHLTLHHVQEMQARGEMLTPKDSDAETTPSEELPQSFSLEPARTTSVSIRSGPFERGGKQWRPESVKVVPPIIQQLGNFSPGVGFYNLVVQGSLDQAVAIWVHELVTLPVSELNNMLLSLYTRQLETGSHG